MLETIEMCHRYSIAVLPGALTPTEMVTAWQAGADVVKVFPASAMGGAKYLKCAQRAAAAGGIDSYGRCFAGDGPSFWRPVRLRWVWARIWSIRRRLRRGEVRSPRMRRPT